MAQTRSCSKANAPAAVRDETRSFPKMFCTWRATVCSLSHELGSDLAVALSGCDQPQHLELARRQPVAVGGSWSAGTPPKRHREPHPIVRTPRELPPARARRRRRHRVPDMRARQHPRACCLVRRSESCHTRRAPQCDERGTWFTRRGRRLRGRGRPSRRAFASRSLSAILRAPQAARASSSSPAASAISTYAGRSLRASAAPSLGHGPSNRSDRGVTSPCASRAREPGLRLEPAAACFLVRLLGLGEVALQPMKLALPIVSLPAARSFSAAPVAHPPAVPPRARPARRRGAA